MLLILDARAIMPLYVCECVLCVCALCLCLSVCARTGIRRSVLLSFGAVLATAARWSLFEDDSVLGAGSLRDDVEEVLLWLRDTVRTTDPDPVCRELASKLCGIERL
jgi:hypothetical protein